MDTSYRELARVRATGGLEADLHELTLTRRDTAYITAYEVLDLDLRALGGPARGRTVAARVQEIDITTGRRARSSGVSEESAATSSSPRARALPGSTMPGPTATGRSASSTTKPRHRRARAGQTALTVFTSWNGSTETAAWRVLGGQRADQSPTPDMSSRPRNLRAAPWAVRQPRRVGL
jgi:hypothetical protein